LPRAKSVGAGRGGTLAAALPATKCSAARGSRFAKRLPFPCAPQRAAGRLAGRRVVCKSRGDSPSQLYPRASDESLRFSFGTPRAVAPHPAPRRPAPRSLHPSSLAAPPARPPRRVCPRPDPCLHSLSTSPRLNPATPVTPRRHVQATPPRVSPDRSVGPARYGCSPRHKLPFHSRDEGARRGLVTWRAISARPCRSEWGAPR